MKSSWDSQDLPIGEAIYKTRTALEMTHEDITAKTGIHRNTLLRLEKGEHPASLPVLLKISEALGIEFSKLVKRAESLRPTQ